MNKATASTVPYTFRVKYECCCEGDEGAKELKLPPYQQTRQIKKTHTHTYTKHNSFFCIVILINFNVYEQISKLKNQIDKCA